MEEDLFEEAPGRTRSTCLAVEKGSISVVCSKLSVSWGRAKENGRGEQGENLFFFPLCTHPIIRDSGTGFDFCRSSD